MAAVPTLSPADLRERLTGSNEIALIDVREEGVFTQRHILLASVAPLSHLELRIGELAPRRSAPIVLCDAGDGLVERAAAVLDAMGYTDVAILDGGIDGWEAAGYVLFSGMNVPSKAFGEFVEAQDGTPHIAADTLNRMKEDGEDHVIVDSRPYGEFHRMSIPGGVNMPGAELVYRIGELAPDPETTIVVNCAGRTRSIIGAQSLINAGVPNRVVALENGTMGWELAGLTVARSATERAADPSSSSRAEAEARAAAVGKRFGVQTTDLAGLDAWRAEANRRTLFMLDVRSPEEFAAGHLPGSRNAPGGQLVQGTDEYVGVRNARIALIDDTGVRATMTASWLNQMGWPEVAVVKGGLDGELETEDPAQAAEAPAVERVSAQALARMLKDGTAAVVDVSDSLTYRAGHVPRSWFLVRARTDADASALPKANIYVVTSTDERHAELAAFDLMAATATRTAVLDGGIQAWRDAGHEVETGFTHMASWNDDVWYKPYDHDDGIEGHMRDYLTWEVDLVAQIERDGTLTFPKFPPIS